MSSWIMCRYGFVGFVDQKHMRPGRKWGYLAVQWSSRVVLKSGLRLELNPFQSLSHNFGREIISHGFAASVMVANIVIGSKGEVTETHAVLL
jgi:hypothetical protein